MFKLSRENSPVFINDAPKYALQISCALETKKLFLLKTAGVEAKTLSSQAVLAALAGVGWGSVPRLLT